MNFLCGVELLLRLVSAGGRGGRPSSSFFLKNKMFVYFVSERRFIDILIVLSFEYESNKVKVVSFQLTDGRR